MPARNHVRSLNKKPEFLTGQEYDNAQYGWEDYEQLPLFMSARDIREQYPVTGDLFQGDTPGPPDAKGRPTIVSNYVGNPEDQKYRSGPSAYEDLAEMKRHGPGGIYNIGPLLEQSHERVTHPKTGKEHAPSYLTIDKSNPDSFVYGEYSSLAEDLNEQGMETPIHLDVVNRMAAGYHRLQWAHDRDLDMLVPVLHGEQFSRCLNCEEGGSLPAEHAEFTRGNLNRIASAHQEAARTGRCPHERLSPSEYDFNRLSSMHSKQHPIY